jgi:hypothetical protein
LGTGPDFTLDRAILLDRLLLDPIHASVGTVLLSLGIGYLPPVYKWNPLLHLWLQPHLRLVLWIVLLAIGMH